MRRAAVAFGLLASALLCAGRAQDRGIVRGRVVAAATGDPVAHARVELAQIGGDRLPAVLTDDKGRFSFPISSAGPHTVSVTKAGYTRGTATSRPADDEVLVALPKGAVISGVVTDLGGEPVPQVSVMIETPPRGERAPTLVQVVMTDDRGEYRATALSAASVIVDVFTAAAEIRLMPNGTYLIAGPGNPSSRIYFPGVATAAQAQTFDLQPGDERVGIDFSVRGRQMIVSTPVADDQISRTAAVITGRVLKGDGRPIQGAFVRLVPGATTDLPMRMAATDANGGYQFVLPDQASGRFRITAARPPTFLDAEYGQRRPLGPGEELEIAAGERRERVDLVLSRGGTIAGRVFDEFGDPLEGVVIHALQVRFVDGRRRLVELNRVANPTDDQGRYRIAYLEPGSYLVSASVGRVSTSDPTVDWPGYGTTYYPGTPAPADAQAVILGRSQDLQGVDFALGRVAAVHVAGRAFESNGDPITGGIALTPSRRSGAPLSMQLGARIERDGRFEFPNVPPGEYVLQSVRHRTSGWNEGESFTQFVTVNAVDIDDLVVRTVPGSSVTGRVVFEGGGSLTPGQFSITAVPEDSDLAPMIGGGPARDVVDDDLTFQLAGLRGPRRLTIDRVPQGWALKAIVVDGVDMTDAPLPFGRDDQSLSGVEVVLTKRLTVLEGTVTDGRGPAAGATVLLFSANRDAWYPGSRFLQKITAARDGTFVVDRVAPGDYFAAAFAAGTGTRNGDEWQDPQTLDELASRAQRLTLAEGTRTSVSLSAPSR